MATTTLKTSNTKPKYVGDSSNYMSSSNKTTTTTPKYVGDTSNYIKKTTTQPKYVGDTSNYMNSNNKTTATSSATPKYVGDTSNYMATTNNADTSNYADNYSTYTGESTQPIIYNDNSQLIVDYLTKMDEARKKSNESLMAKINENFDAYKQLLEAQKESETTRADETAAQRRQIAQDMYNKSMGLLDDNYNSQLDYLKQNYDSALGQINDNYTRNETKLNDNAEQSLREAYLNKMLSMRNLNQALAAQGINGGAAESTLAGMYNNYGNSRNNIETQKASNLADLMGTKESSLAELLQQYNSNLSNAGTEKSKYLMDIENALSNNEINTVQDYQNMLSNTNSNYMNALLNATNQKNSQLYDLANNNSDTSGIQNIINMYKMQLANQ